MIADDVGNLKIRPLTPELLDHAMRKLNEDPKRREADVQAIRDWLKKQAHIVGQPDDQMIITFLRGCKFSLERTKEKLDMYYTIKTMVPELFKNRNLKNNEVLQEILKLGFFFPVGEDDEGRKVYVMVGGKDEPGKYKVEDVMKVNFMMMDHIMMHDDASVIKGTVNVMDMAQMKMAHATQMMPSFIKKITVCSEEGYPFRPQGMNFINMASFLNTIFKLFQSFSKEKINRRTFVHGKDLESLYKKVPRKSLPKEYGGDAGSVDDLAKDFIDKILAFNDWFVADEKNGVDEKKRTGKSKTQQDLFGMEGSFRQLNLD
ncbi:retinol-binding protein pinta-like [Cloeon dipterum]|uniref:retinol-binding protein pinta-like n=1 Tax=Cloeon dipterum TaxID=197152 RepID=UPI00321F9F9D